MVTQKDAIGISQFLHYIKKFDSEVVNRIPKKMMSFLNENADKDYVCDFDYNKPLGELELTPEAHALIGLVCYKYWCETEEQKQALKAKWKENEKIKEAELEKEVSPEYLFRTSRLKDEEREKELEEEREHEANLIAVEEPKGIFGKIIAFFKGLFGKKGK